MKNLIKTFYLMASRQFRLMIFLERKIVGKNNFGGIKNILNFV
jgi:hypothetical protein